MSILDIFKRRSKNSVSNPSLIEALDGLKSKLPGFDYWFNGSPHVIATNVYQGTGIYRGTLMYCVVVRPDRIIYGNSVDFDGSFDKKEAKVIKMPRGDVTPVVEFLSEKIAKLTARQEKPFVL